MIVEKSTLNEIRGSLRQELSRTKKMIAIGNESLNYIKKITASNGLGRFDKIQLINETLSMDFPISANPKDIINTFEDILKDINKHLEKIDRLISSYNKDGINIVTYSFPVFCSLDCSDVQILHYLILMGIKYNGENEKDKNKMDELEEALHILEKYMAGYIQKDFTVEEKDFEAFISIYSSYIKRYYEYYHGFLGDDEEKIISIIDRMKDYLKDNKEIAQKINNKEEEKKKEELRKATPSEIIYPGSPTLNVIDEARERLLQEKQALLDKSAKELSEKRKKLEEVATPEELDLYEKAKVSGIVDATEAIKDIDTAISLLLGETDEEDREILIGEIKYSFNNIRSLLMPEESENIIEEDLYKLYYATNNPDDPSRCWLVRDLADIRENSLKRIEYLLDEFKKIGYNNKTKPLRKRGFFEIKEDQIRIIFKPYGANAALIMGAFIKKSDDDPYYDTIFGRQIVETNEDYSNSVEAYYKDYIEKNGRRGSR